ncbi:carbon starvation CstA family protein [Butyrivibrio sp. YAB3001]|uniref:carbon starvation CstA family protein n=1 Tax=Butyrivibrio sp. YAB3001 TaxID=1520812 RepID=UPI0008F62A60|nr:carbon starvation protein A [Butyrivibrio sp. YAB3001]SFB73628.1 carbon starvation protein [Butyrivibrio sp. YAB3001]
MNAAVLLIVSIVILAAGYVFYGGWLAKQWGIDPSRKTPAHELEDGMDYVPAKTPVVMGHHFSSIAGAGPINGPIQAAVFGWVPVLLWVLIGGIFFGGVHDFGALFASLRNKGQSIGEIINSSMGKGAKKLFLTFGYLTLLLVVAAFSSIVASTFGTTTAAGKAVEGATLAANESTAMISILFILLAIVFGYFVYRKNAHVGVASVLGCLGIVGIVALGLNFHPIALTYNTWMWVVGAYILVASVTPVWILLQPRDYLSSFLLYFMIAAGVIAVVGAVLVGHGNFQVPAFGDAALKGTGVFTTGTAFPALFVTIACGAISGFHSLVSSGTSAKQLDNEKNARPVSYGSMLIECTVAVISLCAIGYVWSAASDGTYASPTQVFAGGLSAMIATFIPGAENIMYQMLILAVSIFCLTSLDTATRLARYMFQEFFVEKGQTYKDLTGYKKVLANPYFATVVTVVLGVSLGMTGYTKIWPLFGAANQLLAAIGLLAVCTWLGSVGKNNKMFYVPMVFMLLVTICSLVQTIMAKMNAFLSGAADYWALIQSVIAVLLVALSLVLAFIAAKTLYAQHIAKKDSSDKEEVA